MALARIDKFVKEDLKRSPLRDTKAGEGKRSRNVEKYLEGLLQAILPVELTSIPESGLNEKDTTVAALSRLADELEMRLAVVNPQSALRQINGVPGVGKKAEKEQTKRSRAEQKRREKEKHHLERVSRLFREPAKPWSKKDVLSLAALFLLYGVELAGVVVKRSIRTLTSPSWFT
ncbi:hypothetical protein BJ322DRAFT_1110126 [Thelephora terrestris]|uniref:Uncharacterized protein n=1 Tax=Thelephora terrestris TaxID=56493 RepID=A0A9P6L5N5_9AGAM|nr:hypothetical protein BJ322DRAFT_1110126 [Thelephora terrestris]